MIRATSHPHPPTRLPFGGNSPAQQRPLAGRDPSHCLRGALGGRRARPGQRRVLGRGHRAFSIGGSAAADHAAPPVPPAGAARLGSLRAPQVRRAVLRTLRSLRAFHPRPPAPPPGRRARSEGGRRTTVDKSAPFRAKSDENKTERKRTLRGKWERRSNGRATLRK